MIVSAVAVLGFPLAEVERLAVVTIMLVEDIFQIGCCQPLFHAWEKHTAGFI
jgi:hypothetical protein